MNYKSVLITWMNLNNIMLSESSKPQKNITAVFHLCEVQKQTKEPQILRGAIWVH